MDLNKSKLWLVLLSVIIPILGLVGLAMQKAAIVADGVPVTFPISGYDPRDLLAGHYVTYQVEYDIPELCESNESTEAQTLKAESVPTCLCFTDISTVPPLGYSESCDNLSQCRLYLKGKCSYHRFSAGIERFYINESKASDIDATVRQGKSRITVKIDSLGNAVVTDLELVSD
ncbi:MAG: GDYXXLXY domain-containing protein [Leptonema sp. (in: Bacteria)]|nr:GDYXXLXY domain-containing protein [Leptonema sp. (in: bacteria)]